MLDVYISLLSVVPLMHYLAFFFCTQPALNKRVTCGGTRFLLAICYGGWGEVGGGGGSGSGFLYYV